MGYSLSKRPVVLTLLGFGCGGTAGFVVGAVVGVAGLTFLFFVVAYQAAGTFLVPIMELAQAPECQGLDDGASQDLRLACRATPTGRTAEFYTRTHHWTSFIGAPARPGPNGEGWVRARWQRPPDQLKDYVPTPGHLVVEAETRGRRLSLVVDTGASASALSRPRFPVFGLDSGYAAGPVFAVADVSANGWGKKYPLRMLGLSDVHVGPLTWPDMVFAVLAIDLAGVDGLIGLTAAGTGVMVVDAARARVGFFGSPESAAAALGLPADSVGPQSAYVHEDEALPLVPWSAGSLSGHAEVDSGCSVTTVGAGSPLAEQLSPLAEGVEVQVGGAVLSGDVNIGKLARLAGLTVAGRPLESTVVRVAPSKFDLTLCTDVLQDSIVIVEPSQRRTWMLDPEG